MDRGEVLFDADGQPVGVVEAVTEDQILIRRRGVISLPRTWDSGEMRVVRLERIVRPEFTLDTEPDG